MQGPNVIDLRARPAQRTLLDAPGARRKWHFRNAWHFLDWAESNGVDLVTLSGNAPVK